MNNNLSPLLVIKDNKLDLYNDKLNIPKYTIYTVARFFFSLWSLQDPVLPLSLLVWPCCFSLSQDP